MTTAISKTMEAVTELRSTQLEIGRLLEFVKTGLNDPARAQEILSRALEKIDDKVFNALSHLGE